MMALPRQLRIISKKTFSYTSTSLLKTNEHFLKQEWHPRDFSKTQLHLQEKYVNVSFVKPNEHYRLNLRGKVGDTLHEVLKNNVNEFNYCDESKILKNCMTDTCGVCHVIFKKEDYDKLPKDISDIELYILKRTSQMTDTSRLGCMIRLTEDLDGLVVQIQDHPFYTPNLPIKRNHILLRPAISIIDWFINLIARHRYLRCLNYNGIKTESHNVIEK